jgi:hypothetical protein
VPHHPGHRRDPDVERVDRVGHLALRDVHRRLRFSFSPPSRTSLTTPTIWRSGSAANSPMTPLADVSRSLIGSPSGQNSCAIASLMITTGGRRRCRARRRCGPALAAILNTSK